MTSEPVVIHPEFDPIAMKWRYEDVTAPTIAALLEKLGPGYEVRDFYRSGTPKELTTFAPPDKDTIIRPSLVDAVPKPRSARRQVVERRAPRPVPPPKLSVPKPIVAAPAPAADRPKPKSAVAMKNEILGHWESGMSGAEISKLLGIPKGTLSKALSRWRAEGDKRAVDRGPQDKKEPSVEPA